MECLEIQALKCIVFYPVIKMWLKLVALVREVDCMAKNADTGLKQLPDGNWVYRVTYTCDGKKRDTAIRLDGNGQPFKRKADAKKARDKKLMELRTLKETGLTGCQLKDIWDCYLQKDAPAKAPATVKKYSSLWNQHIKGKFGDKYITELTVSDINTYLWELYNSGLSWKYVESFLKFFNQLFRFAYSEEKIDSIRYNRMFIDKVTKIKMPEISQEDYEKCNSIQTYNSYEINQISKVFGQGDCYTAFLFGYMCGLRIAETFGLMWGDYNWETHQITVCRQMTREDGQFCLRPVKTLKSSRVIDVPDILHEHLLHKIRKQKRHPTKEYQMRATEIVLDKTKNKKAVEIHGGDFINRKANGELLTINSIRYYASKIKKETGIDFKYHALRRTHLTFLANQNIPAVEVMNRAGHKKFETTMKYYVNQSEESRGQLLDTLNHITTEEQVYGITDAATGQTKLVKEGELIMRKSIGTLIPH